MLIEKSSQTKNEALFLERKRRNVDSIYRINRAKDESQSFKNKDELKDIFKPRVKVKKPEKGLFWRLTGATIAIVLILGFGFVAKAVKEKTDALKLLKNGKYIVVFQNNAELRPTGGFIGSFATVELQDYKIKNINFNTNIYKLDNAYTKTNIITPPEELKNMNQGRWSLRDANFSPDFSESAQKIEWFYDKEAGEKVDGVVAINASVLRDLLKVIGPIQMDQYNTIITYENFFDELAYKIEKEYFIDPQNKEENEPKTILKDMMPMVFSRLESASKTELAKLVYRALEEKQVLFYANDQAIEKAILAQNWGGEVMETQGDYLQINNANLTGAVPEITNGGGKTAIKIKENINYQVENNSGSLVGDLTLTRSHTGSFNWPDGVNINWTRVLVPKGAVLQSATLNGSDITDEVKIAEEAGKTSFGIWINTAPETSNVLNIKYDLPVKPQNYNLLVQKQPGNLGNDLTVSFSNKVLYNGEFNKDLEIK